MIPPSVAFNIALSSATEDYAGLHELVWELNSRFQSESLATKYEAACGALRTLLRGRYISLYERDANQLSSNPAEIPEDKQQEVLCNPVSWYPEYGGREVLFAATEYGQAEYEKQTDA